MNPIKKLFTKLSDSHLNLIEKIENIDEKYGDLSESIQIICETFDEIDSFELLDETLEKLAGEYQNFLTNYKNYQNIENIKNYSILFYNIVYRFLDDLKQEEVRQFLSITDKYKCKQFAIEYDFASSKTKLLDGKTLLIFPKCDFHEDETVNGIIEFISNMGTAEKIKAINYFGETQIDEEDESNCLILYEFVDEESDNINEFTLKLVQLSNNEITHVAIEHESPLPFINISSLEDYEQFDDVLYILSECNQEKKILLKFLKLYQIIENFEIRSELVKMINKQPNKFLSVRNVQKLTDSVEKSEQKALIKLLGSMYKLPYFESDKIKDVVKADFIIFIDSYLTTVQKEVSLARDFSELKIKEVSDPMFLIHSEKLAVIIYQLRCAIVHNKLYEVHLTDKQLSEKEDLVNYLKYFLIPILEKMIYKVISEKNDLLWYECREIKLY